MGGGFSYPQTPDTYVYQQNEGSSWDHWGHVPAGPVTPAQHLSAMSYRDGNEFWHSEGANIGFKLARGYAPTQLLGWDGGTYIQTPATPVPGPLSRMNGWAHAVSEPFTGSELLFADDQQSSYDCRPDNFPNCAFTRINKNAAEVTALYPTTNKDDFTVKYVADVIQDQVNAYSNNQFTYTDSLNSQDTSGYTSACDGPSLLDTLLPLAGGVAMVVLQMELVEPELVLLQLPQQAMFGLTVNTFLAGYYLGKQATSPFGVEEPNGYYAAICLARGAGYVLTSYAVMNVEWEVSTQIAVVVVSTEILTQAIAMPLALYIDKAVNLSSGPVRAISTAFRAIQSWLCHWTTGMVIACDDAQAFPDARRWAIAEVASLLVDELCSEEGWTRKSPQAQYAMKAFLANPAWSVAGLPAVDQYDFKDTPMQTQTWNLTGEIAQTSYWAGGSTLGNDYGVSDIVNPDTTSVGNNFDGFANANSIACQNYEVLISGTGGVGHGGVADPNLPKNFSANLLAWKESIRASARDPANWIKADHIEYLGALSTTPATIMSPTQYLANCTKAAADGGFDDFNDRGVYATIYNPRDYTMTDMEWVLIQLNAMLDKCATVEEYLNRLLAAGVTVNLCGALAYILTEPKGFWNPQRVDWGEWLRSENTQIRDCLKPFTDKKIVPPLDNKTDKPAPPTSLGPTIPNSKYNNISVPELQLLEALWAKDSEDATIQFASDVMVTYPHVDVSKPDVEPFNLVLAAYTYLYFNDINAAWETLQSNGIFAVPNKYLNIPQGYAMIHAMITLRPANGSTVLANDWFEWYNVFDTQYEQILAKYPNPFAQK